MKPHIAAPHHGSPRDVDLSGVAVTAAVAVTGLADGSRKLQLDVPRPTRPEVAFILAIMTAPDTIVG
jgi:hypothetical protein